MNTRNENRQNLPQKAEELIRSYRVPTRLSKQEVLNQLLSKIEETENAKNVRVHRITWFRAAVSVAATVAVVVTFWLFMAAETVSSRAGDTLAFRLPDDSRVVLHNESSLSYRKYFWKRNVKLEGEAYFEVEKGNGFKVNTPSGNVEVLGTRFLVKEETDIFTVQCYQGKVKAGIADESWILEPGIEFTRSQEKAEMKVFNSESEYPHFARFRKSFENVPLRAVLAEVEAFFGVNIKMDGSAEKNFSGAVETGSLENVLRIVTESLHLEYIFEDKYSITILD
jgi:transmembrane sensor